MLLSIEPAKVICICKERFAERNDVFDAFISLTFDTALFSKLWFGVRTKDVLDLRLFQCKQFEFEMVSSYWM